MIPHELSGSEILGLLSRHPLTAARVAEFKSLVLLFGYNSVKQSPGFLSFDITVPGSIPASGIGILDDVWHEVQIAPEADGDLRYIAGNPLPGFAALAQPEFSSPLPEPEPDTDWLRTLLKYARWAIVLLLAGYFLFLFSLTRERA